MHLYHTLPLMSSLGYSLLPESILKLWLVKKKARSCLMIEIIFLLLLTSMFRPLTF